MLQKLIGSRGSALTAYSAPPDPLAGFWRGALQWERQRRAGEGLGSKEVREGTG